MRANVLCLVALCLAAPVAAKDTDPKVALITAFERNNCRLTSSQARRAFTDAGMDGQAAVDTAMTMMSDGEIKFADGGDTAVLQIGDQCSGVVVPDEPFDPKARATLVEAHETNDCKLTEDAINDLEAAFDDGAIEAALVAMANAGDISITGTVSTLRTGDVCAP